ncbi:CHAT domain-containing protein [Spiribacter halobius]|nr:CHAT domain-containing protein [Spiribacter halobius]UEX76924.1 CHAT domain-containing protein [Spiribacter halobius]
MSLTAATELVRRLERISTDLLRRAPDAELDDLLAAALHLERDVRAVRVPDLTGAWHLRLGEILFRSGRDREAASHADAALQALGPLREADLHVAALELEARCRDRLGEWEALDTAVERGIGIVERHRYSLSGPYLQAGYMRARIGLYALGVRAALRRGDHDRLVRRAELSKCRSFSVVPRDLAASPQVSGLQRRLRAVTERINREQRAGRTPTRLLAERRALWDRLVSAGRREAVDDVPDLASLRGALNPREAVLYYYWVDRTELLRLTLDGSRLVVESVPVTAERRQALDRFAAALTADSERVEKHLVDRIDEFRDLLWPEDADARAILAGAERLIISPHRQLHSLPLGALAVDEGYVIARWAVRFAPNLAALLARPARSGQRRALLTLGVSRYQVPNVTLAELPAAIDECREIRGLYGTDGWEVAELLDEAATEAAILEAAQRRPAVAHLACHGESVNADTPLESCLYLHRSVLDGLEIPLMGLAANTVVLSACCAGQRAIAGRGMAELPGDDLLGLQAAFFAGGTSEIVATLFPVEDKAARRICAAFHRHRLAGQPADLALASAVREFIASAGVLTRRRYYWSAFFLTAVGPNAPLPANPATAA